MFFLTTYVAFLQFLMLHKLLCCLLREKINKILRSFNLHWSNKLHQVELFRSHTIFELDDQDSTLTIQTTWLFSTANSELLKYRQITPLKA